MTQDQDRKMEVLKFTGQLRTAGVTTVTVSYYGDGDEGRAEPPQFQDAACNPIDKSSLPADLDTQKLVTCSKVSHPKDMRTARADTERLPSTFKRARFASNTTGMKSSAIPRTLGRFDSWPIL